MLENYLITAWRNLNKNKLHSFINIVGLSVGMSVATLIGLWIWDEISFDQYHLHHDRIAMVMENDNYMGEISTSAVIPLPLETEMKRNYGSAFKHIVMASWNDTHILGAGDKKISSAGTFMGTEAPDMFTLDMVEGSRSGLAGTGSMLIAQSLARALFGKADPMNKLISLDNKASFTVSGVYQDLPENTTLHDVTFMAPWDFYVNSKDWINRDPEDWKDNSLFMYVQIADNTDMTAVSQQIRDVKLHRVNPADAKLKPQLFLQPMNKWHLYSEFKNGVNTGGAIEYVRVFALVGAFILLLACINFMNLSTARSEKRAKEVGIRKAIGSLRIQLIAQFFCESILLSFLSFCISLALVQIMLPFFNSIAGKSMHVFWSSPVFWEISLGFTLITGIIAGSYPAMYLSSFKPVKVLKGTFKAGRLAALPRKVLVVLQFSVSIILIIVTGVVLKQIQFAKDRPVGYIRSGLVDIETTNDDLFIHFEALRHEATASGVITEVAGSSNPTTGIDYERNDLDWKGKDPSSTISFGNIGVSAQYGKAIDWRVLQGKDFSGSFHADSASLILNEAAVKFMGFKNPVGEIIRVGKRDLTVIGVVKDMVMGSPYEQAKPSIFHLALGGFGDVIFRIKPNVSAHEALEKIAGIVKTYSPSVPFSYRFVDDEYAKKFESQERKGKLGGFFTVLAILISCLGLFGMATFMAEQRIKEIGIRKILGAGVFTLWQLLSKDFLYLTIIAFLIGSSLSFYFMSNWLMNYSYRTTIPWWIIAAAGLSTMVITLITVSFQAVKTALSNPVKSLRSD